LLHRDDDGHCCEENWKFFKEAMAGLWDTTGAPITDAFDQIASGQVVDNVRDTYLKGQVVGKLGQAAGQFVFQIRDMMVGAVHGDARSIGRIPGILISAKVSSSLKASTIPEAAAPKAIVLGEEMRRVRMAAKGLGAETFKGNGMAANRAWIAEKLSENYSVYDIGPDFRRRLDRLTRGENPNSPFYEMERAATKDYPRYYKLFQRSGKYRGGATGID